MPTIEELQAELEAAKAKRQAAVKAREDRNAPLELARQIELENRAAADEEALAAAEAEHGLLDVSIAAVYTDCGVVIVKRPPALIFRRFQEMGKTKEEDFLKLVRPCLVHPTKEAFEEYCSTQPATLLRVADAVAVLAGVRTDEVRGK